MVGGGASGGARVTLVLTRQFSKLSISAMIVLRFGMTDVCAKSVNVVISSISNGICVCGV